MRQWALRSRISFIWTAGFPGRWIEGAGRSSHGCGGSAIYDMLLPPLYDLGLPVLGCILYSICIRDGQTAQPEPIEDGNMSPCPQA